MSQSGRAVKRGGRLVGRDLLGVNPLGEIYLLTIGLDIGPRPTLMMMLPARPEETSTSQEIQENIKNIQDMPTLSRIK